MDDQQLRAVAMIAEEKTYKDGNDIVINNTPASKLFFLVEGSGSYYYIVTSEHDPYYKKAPQKYEGTDQTGYKRDYDPSMQYYEETTTYKTVEKKGKKGKYAPPQKTEEPPARWENTQ
jgi:hypothetical protein